MDELILTVEWNSALARLRFIHELHRTCLADFKEYQALPSTNFDINKFQKLNNEIATEMAEKITELYIMISQIEKL